MSFQLFSFFVPLFWLYLRVLSMKRVVTLYQVDPESYVDMYLLQSKFYGIILFFIMSDLIWPRVYWYLKFDSYSNPKVLWNRGRVVAIVSINIVQRNHLSCLFVPSCYLLLFEVYLFTVILTRKLFQSSIYISQDFQHPQ